MKKFLMIALSITLVMVLVGCKGSRTGVTNYNPNAVNGFNANGITNPGYNQFQDYYTNGQVPSQYASDPWSSMQYQMTNSPGVYVGQNNYGMQQGYYNGGDMYNWMNQNYWYFAQNQMQYQPQFQGYNPYDYNTYMMYQQMYMPFVSPYQGCNGMYAYQQDQFSTIFSGGYNTYDGWNFNVGGAYNNCF